MNWNKPGSAVNRTGFVIVLAAVMAGTAWAGQKLEREQRHTVRVDGHTVVSVSNPRGKTVIVGREGAAEVVVVATKIAKAGNAEKTEELLARLHYEVREENGKIIVRTVTEGMDKGHNVWSLLRGDRQLACVDYAIEVPHDFSVEALTTSGDVRVTNVAGPVVITATSGAIALREIDPGIPRPLESICRKAMAEEPAERYSGATAIAEDIDRLSAAQLFQSCQ